jgi:hypothetical protein
MKRTRAFSVLFIFGFLPMASRAGETMGPSDRQAGPEQPMPANMSPGAPMGSMMPQPGFRLYGWLEDGITFNPASPNDNQNFGRLFDDRANEPLLNQFVLSAERGFELMTEHLDWAFRAQFLYGSDARYLHSTGLLDLATNDIVQPDIPELWILAHFPIKGTAGGIDLKIGKFATSVGAEMADPHCNTFYSHSYIYNFGAPFNATGVVATLHGCKSLDVIAGVTRGVNIGIEDNNDSASFYGGVTVNCCNNKLSCADMTHIGPEDPKDNHDYRYFSAITTTWKITDKLTSITDLNYAYEEGFDAQGYGAAQYLTYSLNDCCSISLRAEAWRDEDEFFVAQFASNNDFLHFERGDATMFDPRTTFGGRTTYGAITAGVTIKPKVAGPLSELMIRPEIRYDCSLNDTRPFNDSSDRDMFTAAVDLVVTF